MTYDHTTEYTQHVKNPCICDYKGCYPYHELIDSPEIQNASVRTTDVRISASSDTDQFQTLSKEKIYE